MLAHIPAIHGAISSPRPLSARGHTRIPPVRLPPTLRLAALLLALFVIAAACGDDDEPSDATPDAQTSNAGASATATLADLAGDPYLQAIAGISAMFNASNEAIDETLSQTWPVRSRLIDTLLAADRPGLATAMLDQLNSLEPPAEYGADHAAFVEVLEASVEFAKQEQIALEDGDLVGAVLLLSELRLLNEEIFLPTVSPQFCSALFQFDPDGSKECEGSDGIEELYGDYGVQLFAAFDRYRREFAPRVGVFYAALSPEERFASLRILQPEIIAAMDNAIVEIEALSPPAELAADHARLLRYFAEIRQTALDINAAIEAEDTPLLLQHFGASAVVNCNAANDLSDAIDPLLGFFFQPECEDAG
jgi:2-phospho-L-lactate guanylyltransferase (CobY/MobA/RfbA family)